MTSIEHQRRLNPNLKDVVKKEILKLLDAAVIYPISHSKWVSPVHVVPKAGGITVFKNDKDELIPTRTITDHRMCIDYRKLNSASRKDHFPLPFIDQMLERLANHPFYCFLDGYSGFFQIPIHPNDQEKTIFSCPYGTFAYRRMLFGLCNAPATFQQAPPKRARAPRSTRLGALVLEKGTKGDAEEGAPPKRAKAPRNSGVGALVIEKTSNKENEGEEDEISSNDEQADPKSRYDRRDRSKTPTEDELLDFLRNGIAWVPTRFVHKMILQELYLDDDVEEMLKHMKVGSLYSAAYPTHKEVSCQFLATLEATFHTSKHTQQGWGEIKFKIEGEVYSMSFKEISEVLDLEDQKNPSLPTLKTAPKEKTIAESMWTLLTGQGKGGQKKEKNGAIRHPTMRYLHRLLNHTLFQRKEVGNVSGDELRFLHQTARHFVSSPQLPSVPDDFYSEFGPQIDIGGWITPLIAYQGIDLGEDGISPTFLDGAYLRKAQFLSGRFKGRCVYSYSRGGKKAELLLPSPQLTSLSTTRDISFDISEEHLLRSHGPLCPVNIPKGDKDASKQNAYEEAHDHIKILQRWNKAQDRTIFKLTNNCKELKRTVKRQAEISARLLKKVADVLARGAVAGCKAEDFDLDALNAPPPQPLIDSSAPQSSKQALRRWRNPYIAPSESGNKSPSLSTTADEDDSEGGASASSHAP
ncbi:hypothetical protein Bca101_057488 [Brassica carinata]